MVKERLIHALDNACSRDPRGNKLSFEGLIVILVEISASIPGVFEKKSIHIYISNHHVPTFINLTILSTI